jgi:hypothetical protein
MWRGKPHRKRAEASKRRPNAPTDGAKIQENKKVQMKNTALAASAFVAADVFLVVYIVMLIYGFSITAGACRALKAETAGMAELADLEAVCRQQTDPVSWLTLASGRLFHA